MKSLRLRVIASILSILFILATPMLKLLVPISDAVIICAITTIGSIGVTFMVIQHNHEKRQEEKSNGESY